MKKGVWVCLLCLSMLPGAMGQNLFMVTEQSQLEGEGTKNLAGYLRDLGYKVTVDEGAGNGASNYTGSLSADKIAHLESFDAVIIHRAISSGSYSDTAMNAQWNQLKVPLLLGSAYLARNTRWFWVDALQERSTWEGVDIVKPDHPIVKGLTGVFFDTPLGIDHVGVGDVGEGTIVATILNSSGADAPAIVAWEPNQAFTAAGKQIHTYARVFLPIYRYHETTDNAGGSYADDPADGDFPNYTQNGLELIHQAIQWLLSFKTDVKDWSCY